MALMVVTSAQCKCPFGTALSPVVAASVNGFGVNYPIATIMDVPKLPFGLCNSLTNPGVAAATAAAGGALTPIACTPVVPAPWAPGSPTVLHGGKPVLNNTSKCVCVLGQGVIEIASTPATTIKIP